MNVKTVKLDADDARVFDEYLAASEECRKVSPHQTTKKKAGQHLADRLGDELFGRLPDGRIVQRIPKSSNMPAQPARENKWNEFKLLEKA